MLNGRDGACSRGLASLHAEVVAWASGGLDEGRGRAGGAKGGSVSPWAVTFRPCRVLTCARVSLAY